MTIQINLKTYKKGDQRDRKVVGRPNEFDTKTKEMALARQKNRCASCGTPISALGYKGINNHQFGEQAEAHHMRHVQQGGTNNLNNCVILCKSCHYSAHEGGNYRNKASYLTSTEEDYPHFYG